MSIIHDNQFIRDELDKDDIHPRFHFNKSENVLLISNYPSVTPRVDDDYEMNTPLFDDRSGGERSLLSKYRDQLLFKNIAQLKTFIYTLHDYEMIDAMTSLRALYTKFKTISKILHAIDDTYETDKDNEDNDMDIALSELRTTRINSIKLGDALNLEISIRDRIAFYKEQLA